MNVIIDFDDIFDCTPATSVRSHTPSVRSVINTAAVTNVAKKKTILQKKNNTYFLLASNVPSRYQAKEEHTS